MTKVDAVALLGAHRLLMLTLDSVERPLEADPPDRCDCVQLWKERSAICPADGLLAV